jgi:hypothetical protein
MSAEAETIGVWTCALCGNSGIILEGEPPPDLLTVSVFVTSILGVMAGVCTACMQRPITDLAEYARKAQQDGGPAWPPQLSP